MVNIVLKSKNLSGTCTYRHMVGYALIACTPIIMVKNDKVWLQDCMPNISQLWRRNGCNNRNCRGLQPIACKTKFLYVQWVESSLNKLGF